MGVHYDILEYMFSDLSKKLIDVNRGVNARMDSFPCDKNYKELKKLIKAKSKSESIVVGFLKKPKESIALIIGTGVSLGLSIGLATGNIPITGLKTIEGFIK